MLTELRQGHRSVYGLGTEWLLEGSADCEPSESWF